MSVETNWQTTRPTIRERAKFMFNNDRLSDVKFVVRRSEGESESKQVIPAHKFVLSIGSPVFEAMFYGDLAETRDSIELPDCEYETLLELFRYLYSDEVNLSGSSAMGVLYLAKKYIVPSLVDKCTEYLQDKLDPSNVFSILPTALRYDEKSLVDRCWKVIDEKTEMAVKSDGFEAIEWSLLEAVVSRDTLTIEEIELFKAVDLWATKQCQEQGLAANGEQKRRVLREQIITAIRFPVMKIEEFAAVVLDTNILTPDEVIVLVKFYTSTLTSPVGFSQTRRQGVICRCGRFQSVSKGYLSYKGEKDYLLITVNKDIMLHGVCLFGSENNNYTGTLEIIEAYNVSGPALVSKTGTFTSKHLQHKSDDFHGFEVWFDHPARLMKTTKYRIQALISGPQSFKGAGGMCTVQSSGVTFKFDSSVNVGNGTNQAEGQFPEFLFTEMID